MSDLELPLTLVLVSYNKADTIGLAIDSVAAGSKRPDLLVVSDDGSSDDTLDVAVATAQRHGIPCRILRHLRVARYRLQTMRNAAIANALDGVIMMSDSDCIFGRHSLASHYEIHRAPMRVGTGPRFEYLEGSSGPFHTTFFTLECAHFPTGSYVVPVGANTSFRKSLWKLLGGFDRAYEGSYGMDEFEFCLRAEQAGAECVSDPGAYIFHIPHDTIFGGRSADKNIVVFDRNFDKDHIGHEWYYIARRAVPWYLKGNRKRPLLGDDVRLDSWGAPDGFRPPPYLEFTRSLRSLIEPVERFIATRNWKNMRHMWDLMGSIDLKLLGQTTPAAIFIPSLRHTLNSVRDGDEMVERLSAWKNAVETFEKKGTEAAAAS